MVPATKWSSTRAGILEGLLRVAWGGRGGFRRFWGQCLLCMSLPVLWRANGGVAGKRPIV